MKALQELSFILTKGKLKTVDLFKTNADGQPQKLKTFYEGILQNRFQTDDEAASFFFGADATDQAYQKLKANLKSRLVNALFLIDLKQPSYNERQKAYYECYKDWAAAKILLGKDARAAGFSLYHKVLKIAKKYEFTDLVLDIARTLCLHYATREGDLKKYEQYKELYQIYERLYMDEAKAEVFYADLVARYANSKATQGEIREKAGEYFHILNGLLETSDSYGLRLCAMMIQLIYVTSIHDYRAAIEVCDNYIAYFEAKEYVANIPLQICYYQLLVCFTQLKEFDKGKHAALKCLSSLEEGSFNWFKYREQYFLLSMHTRNYQEAYHIFLDTQAHSKYKLLPSNVLEYWRIFEAYIYYLIEIQRIKVDPGNKKSHRFKLNKFLNDMPIFSKDKRGLNISILIVQILLLIHYRKHDAAMGRIESIEKYCSRYLRHGDTFWSNCFIKMLLQIPKSKFQTNSLIRKTEKLVELIKSVPLESARQTSEIEIVPYEDLWELVLDTTSKSNRKVRTLKFAMENRGASFLS